jgi:hypothetical protein
MQTSSHLRKIITIFFCVFSGVLLTTGVSFGFFSTLQNAQIELSAPGFDNAGYLNSPGDGLLFNHPGNISTDGTHLFLADTWNNRVLIWNSLPTGNVSPNIVLGQTNLTTNNSGTGIDQLNWPVGVAAANGKVAVADTYNNRILIWNTFPTQSGQAADLSISNLPAAPVGSGFSGSWPWAIWTNGTKLVVTATQANVVLIWNTFPTANNQTPDITLTGKDPSTGHAVFGTPRSIGTDGSTYLIIGDHNAYPGGAAQPGNFFWNTFPTSDQAWSFMIHDPWNYYALPPGTPSGLVWGGQKTTGGKFVALAYPGIGIWNSLPTTTDQNCDTFVGSGSGRDIDPPNTGNGYHFWPGDNGDLIVAPNGYVYVSLDAANIVVGYMSLPTGRAQLPDFAIGSPDIDTHTYFTHGFLDNPAPATNGTFLIATSDLDRKLAVWNSIPTQSGTPPDQAYDLGTRQLRMNVLYGNTFVAAGDNGLAEEIDVWTSLPPTSSQPDLVFSGSIGTASFVNIGGVALDSKYFYVADTGAGKVYVWNAMPSSGTSPLFSLSVNQPANIVSDGNYLAVIDGSIWGCRIYQVNGLSASSTPLVELPASGASYKFDAPGPTSVLIANNSLFLSDATSGRVLAWSSISTAISGSDPDVILGQPNLTTAHTEGTAQDMLFWPGRMAFNGTRLWVGAYKFAGRLMAFSMASQSSAFVPLLSGWNLISLPMQPADATIASVLSPIAGAYQVVWAYASGSWTFYDPTDPDGSTLTTMAAGNGYWINMTSAETLTVSGSAPSSSLSLLSGWNLVGYNGTSCTTAASALSSIASTLQASWGYPTQAWKVYDPNDVGGSTLTQFCPNYGYWLKVQQAATWKLP